MSTLILRMPRKKSVSQLRSRISSNLKRLRLEKNYTQQYVAEYLGKTEYSSYQRLEYGDTELSLHDAAMLAKLYKLPIEYIWDPSLEPHENQVNEKPHENEYRTPSTSKMQLHLELDGTEKTLQKQIELLTSINDLLKSKK